MCTIIISDLGLISYPMIVKTIPTLMRESIFSILFCLFLIYLFVSIFPTLFRNLTLWLSASSVQEFLYKITISNEIVLMVDAYCTIKNHELTVVEELFL